MNLKKIEKFIKLGWHKIKNKVLLIISLLTGKILVAPKLYYLMTNKCNFHCQMCPQWKIGQTENKNDYLSIFEIKRIIDDAFRLGVNYFGVSGGEPLLYKDKMLKILEYANQKGLYTHFTTNGCFLTKEIIQKYNQIGGGHITLSVDAVGQKHNELRGQEYAYQGIMRAIQIFKKVDPDNIWLKINLVITSKNLDEILKVANLAELINAKLFIQPYEPYNFSERAKISWEEMSGKYPLWISPREYPELESVINKIVKIKQQNPALIFNSKKELALILEYFSLKPRKKKCLVAYQSLVIDPFGNIDMCKYGTVDSLRKNSLKEVWHSEKIKNLRSNSLNCPLNCLLGCYYEPSILEMLRIGLKMILSK